MPKLKVKKLTDLDVEFVSLVDRPANQLPFKIVKKDSNMKVTKEDLKEKASILGVAVSRGADIETVRNCVKESGIYIAREVEREDGTLLCSGYAENTAQVELGEGVSVVVEEDFLKGVKSVYEMNNYEDKVKSSTLFPSIGTATYIMLETMYESVMQAATPSEASKVAGSVLDSFSSYVKSLVKELPKEAFKMSYELRKAKYQQPKTAPEYTKPEVDDNGFDAMSGMQTETFDDGSTRTKGGPEDNVSEHTSGKVADEVVEDSGTDESVEKSEVTQFATVAEERLLGVREFDEEDDVPVEVDLAKNTNEVDKAEADSTNESNEPANQPNEAELALAEQLSEVKAELAEFKKLMGKAFGAKSLEVEDSVKKRNKTPSSVMGSAFSFHGFE